jgi:hypothetical protein
MTYLGLIVYFFLSIFAFPFLLARLIDASQRRAERRQQQAVQRAYEDSPLYRRQRLLTLKQRFLYTHKVRWRAHAELCALLHALYLYGEPCWWCNRPATEPAQGDFPPEASTQCSRCGLPPTEQAERSQFLSDD